MRPTGRAGWTLRPLTWPDPASATEANWDLKSERETRSSDSRARLRPAGFLIPLVHVGRALRVASNTRPEQYYELAVDHAGDVTCSCPGFEHGARAATRAR